MLCERPREKQDGALGAIKGEARLKGGGRPEGAGALSEAVRRANRAPDEEAYEQDLQVCVGQEQPADQPALVQQPACYLDSTSLCHHVYGPVDSSAVASGAVLSLLVAHIYSTPAIACRAGHTTTE